MRDVNELVDDGMWIDGWLSWVSVFCCTLPVVRGVSNDESKPVCARKCLERLRNWKMTYFQSLGCKVKLKNWKMKGLIRSSEAPGPPCSPCPRPLSSRTPKETENSSTERPNLTSFHVLDMRYSCRQGEALYSKGRGAEWKSACGK